MGQNNGGKGLRQRTVMKGWDEGLGKRAMKKDSLPEQLAEMKGKVKSLGRVKCLERRDRTMVRKRA